MAKSKSAGGTRRSSAEVEELVRKAAALIAGGMDKRTAYAKVDIAESVFRNNAKKLGLLAPKGAVAGSVRADQIPPRPKRGGKGGARVPKPVDENDVQSLAHRVSVLDRKLAGVDDMQKERKRLAARLLKLLQGDSSTPE